jgi:hypothetical protein
MDAEAARCVLREVVVLAPGVGHRSGERDHPSQRLDLLLHGSLLITGLLIGHSAQRLDELVAVLGE